MQAALGMLFGSPRAVLECSVIGLLRDGNRAANWYQLVREQELQICSALKLTVSVPLFDVKYFLE